MQIFLPVPDLLSHILGEGPAVWILTSLQVILRSESRSSHQGPPTCSGFAGHVAVLVNGLGGLILGLSDHWRHGRCVDVGEDTASHPLGEGRSARSVALAK